jgi:hypothetical protein
MDAARLRYLLDYDTETGLFVWAGRSPAPNGKRAAGCAAGTLNNNGYVSIKIDQSSYKAHRLAWLWVTGEWPDGEIDHRNGVRSDNRFSNLRVASKSQNQQNRKLNSNNKSGYAGVSWFADTGQWVANIMADGCQKYLGLFDTAEEASARYLEAKAALHTFQPTPRYAEAE